MPIDIARLPASAHCHYVRKYLEKERNQLFQRNTQATREKLYELENVLTSLRAVEMEVRNNAAKAQEGIC